MLDHWWIENFKSFSGRTPLDLTRLNVFAGANSSGKSTLLQSILLIKQTLQYAPSSRALALNGPILKLGTFTDVKNFKAEADYIGIGWTIDASGRYDPTIDYDSAIGSPYYGSIYWGRGNLSKVSTAAKWTIGAPGSSAGREGLSISDDLRNLHPSLLSSDLTILRRDDDRRTAQTSHIYVERKTERSLNRSVSAARDFFTYDVKELDDTSEREIVEDKPDAKILGCNLTHFSPGQFAVQFDAAKLRARRIVLALASEQPRFTHDRTLSAEGELPPSVFPTVLDWLRGGNAPPPTIAQVETLAHEGGDERLERLQSILQRLRYESRPAIGERGERSKFNFSDLASQLDAVLLRDIAPKIDLAPAFSRAGLEATEFLRVFFTNYVRYLGPLRDEPRPIYPLEALANPADVGFRGEHTAAVLDLNRERRIKYMSSAAFQVTGIKGSLQFKSLHDAVVDWLAYVGVAHEVTTTDKGTFGHQMQVQTEGASVYHDLTNVGVGVSQVLPIIVMALLAPERSVLIFEQPELHLHPKVQARLADFFLSMSLSNKQCILETHSEYLVERLRLRVAQAEDDNIRELISLYFTERVEGCTSCRKVEISEYGAVVNWPDDFFDQSQKEIEAILQAASEKRAKQRASRT